MWTHPLPPSGYSPNKLGEKVALLFPNKLGKVAEGRMGWLHLVTCSNPLPRFDLLDFNRRRWRAGHLLCNHLALDAGLMT